MDPRPKVDFAAESNKFVLVQSYTKEISSLRTDVTEAAVLDNTIVAICNGLVKGPSLWIHKLFEVAYIDSYMRYEYDIHTLESIPKKIEGEGGPGRLSNGCLAKSLRSLQVNARRVP